MAKEVINIGAALDDPAAESVRSAFDKSNKNFTELYGRTDSNIAVQQVYLNVDFSAVDQNAVLYTALNAKPQFQVWPNGFLTFVTYRREFLSATSTRVTTKRYFVRGQVAVQSDGKGYLGVNHNVGPDTLRFYRLEQEVAVLGDGDGSGYKLVDLADIGTDTIEAAFNAANNNPDNLLTGELLMVKATQGGVAKRWIYVGDGSTTPTIASDFEELPSTSGAGDPSDPDTDINKQKTLTENTPTPTGSNRTTFWLDNAAARIFTVDVNTMEEAYESFFENINAGQWQFVAAGGTVLQAPNGDKLDQDKHCSLIRVHNTNVVRLKGELTV